jgi:hypothetical protein
MKLPCGAGMAVPRISSALLALFMYQLGKYNLETAEVSPARLLSPTLPGSPTYPPNVFSYKGL